MESYIKISNLNDFIFCPRSIYFHGLYEDYRQSLYHRKAQKKGKLKHKSIDFKKYSGKKRYLQSLEIFSEKYKLCGKIDNQLSLLKKIRKKAKEEKKCIKKLKILLNEAKNAKSDKELLGIEGSASRDFFHVYFRDINWHKRLPRTKYDINNTLLDIGYTYLFNFVDAHLRLYGFDNYMGFFHKLFYQRKSLVCDFVEPFRSIIDQALLKANHLGQIDESDFKIIQKSYHLKWQCSRKYTKIFFEAIIDKKEEIYTYIYDFYKCLMKDDENYPIFNI